MEAVESYNEGLRTIIKNLIENKTQRDRKKFTIYQLAKSINMPHSMLVKLVHPDPNKRVNNPRIDTLAKIVEFFKQDGFNISLNDLLAGVKTSTKIKISEQKIDSFTVSKSIPTYSFNANLKVNLGTIQIKLTRDSTTLIALMSDEDIKPIFKKGSLFIVDTALKPEHDNLLAVNLNNANNIDIRKLYLEGNKRILRSYDPQVAPIELTPMSQCKIIGVVVQVNAKT